MTTKASNVEWSDARKICKPNNFANQKKDKNFGHFKNIIWNA